MENDKLKNYFTCPCCGKKTESLTLCDAHEWEDEEENEKYRELLDKIKPNAGIHAYVGHGCSVCPDCEEAFHWKSKYCPLAILRNGLYAFGSDGCAPAPSSRSCRCWDSASASTGHPDNARAPHTRPRAPAAC